MTRRVLRCEDGWTVVADGPLLEDAAFCGTAFTLSNGYLATRGTCPKLGAAHGRPATFIAGTFEQPPGDRPPRLAEAPDWLPFKLSDGHGELTDGDGAVSEEELALDLRAGTLTRRLRWTGARGRSTRLEITRLVSLEAPHLAAERFCITPEDHGETLEFSNALEAGPGRAEGDGSLVSRRRLELPGVASALAMTVRTRAPGAELVAVSALRSSSALRGGEATPDGPIRHRCRVAAGETIVIDRVVGYASSRDQVAGAPLARASRTVAEAPPWDELLASQRRSLERFWRRSGVDIEGDPESQWMLRFCLFHLWQCASENTAHTDASIGARGIHGEGYGGHVFWDTDTFVLPFFTLTQPEVARALLMYRYRRLPAARRRARRDDGLEGARFPWESADSGDEVTPTRSAPNESGEVIRIRTGEEEIHITADVAHAVWSYCAWSGDQEFYLQHGAEIILDTARFWAGRLEPRLGTGGAVRYELTGVIGPDEYHESVANDLYTNAMARWNLRRAAAVGRDLQQHHPARWQLLAAALRLEPARLDEWEAMADRIVIPFDEARKLHPQCDGFFEFEDGRDRCAYRDRWRIVEAQKVQIVKQPDVLLALHLLPELADAASFARHFDYFDPRTTHESSLSPAMHALFAARVGRPALALDYLRKALALDCVSSGASDSGIHAANLGAVWAAVATGFAGVRPGEELIEVEPCLPRHWTALTVPVSWRGARLRFRITDDEVVVALEQGEAAVPLRIEGRDCTVLPGAPQTFARRAAEEPAARPRALAER